MGPPETLEALRHDRQQSRLHAPVLAPVRRPDGAAPHDDLRAIAGLGLKQDRVHVHARLDAGRLRLRGLRPPDLAAIGRDRGVERHVLRLEGGNAVTRAREETAEGGGQDALADARARPLHHQAGRQVGHVVASVRDIAPPNVE